MYVRASRWLATPRVERWLVLAAFVFSLPSLGIGLQADDFDLRQELQRDGPLAAYRFTQADPERSRSELLQRRDAGTLAWWSDENFHQRFFRPLSSLSLWLDFELLPSPAWMHLENCLLYALIVWLVASIYRQAGLSGVGFGLALLFWALQGSFAVSVGWISARNTLLAVTFGLACIWLHDRARTSPARAWALPLAWLAFGLALLSAEFGICALGYLVAHALLIDRASWRGRALALAPYALLLALYLAHYYYGNFGVSGSGFYRDLRGAPLEAALGFAVAVPVYVASALTVSYASLYALGAFGPLLVSVLALSNLAILLPMMAKGWRAQPRASWFALGGLLSLCPLIATVPQDRLTFFISLAACGLIGPWIAAEVDAADKWRRRIARVLWRMHGIYMPALFIPLLFVCRSMTLGGGALALDAVLPRSSEPAVVLLNAPTHLTLHYQAVFRSLAGIPKPPLLMLYAGSQPLEVTRSGPRSLELKVAHSWFATALERNRDLRRSPYRAGDRVSVQHMTAEIRAVDPAGAPTRVDFTFDEALENAPLSFLSWQARSIEAWQPPALGKTVQLRAAATF